MIIRINGREEPKQDLQVRLGEAMLRLGGEVRLGEALLRLGGPKSAETLGSGSPRRMGVKYKQKWTSFGHFHRKFSSKQKPTQPKLKINHKTHLIPTNNTSNRIFPTQLRQREISIHNPYT